jgi:hypothetical protein
MPNLSPTFQRWTFIPIACTDQKAIGRSTLDVVSFGRESAAMQQMAKTELNIGSFFISPPCRHGTL